MKPCLISRGFWNMTLSYNFQATRQMYSLFEFVNDFHFFFSDDMSSIKSEDYNQPSTLKIYIISSLLTF